MPGYGVNLPPEGLDRLLDAEALAGRQFRLRPDLIRELSQQVTQRTPMLEGADRLRGMTAASRMPAVASRGVGSPGLLGLLAALLSLSGSSDPEVLRHRGLLPPKEPETIAPIQPPMLHRMEYFTRMIPKARRLQEPQEDLNIPPWR